MPEEGSQFYQPETEDKVTRTYKNDEFFVQVLKQGQSPKSQGHRLAVTGEPGAGKTTLLQKIAHWVAAETERDVAIWVSLADLQGRTIEEYLRQKWLKDALRAVRVTPEMEDALALQFKSGRVWLLLDGVDEMAAGGNPLAAVAAQITGWVAQARVVVTCRQNVWDARKNALEGFDVYRNLDFDYPDGVAQFIQRWFARHRELGERLLAELGLAGKERIRDTVKNPLRLALLCRAWQIRQGGLPETKAGLYGQFAEALYEWKQEVFPTTSQQRRELNAGLGRLALRGMEQSESRFRLREGLVREVVGETDEPLCRLVLQLGWLNLVGVAVENPDERVYAFYHPTFQEYFAALAVDDWGYFLHHVPDNPRLGSYRIFEKQWKEVILLWFGRENLEKKKEKKEAFIEALIGFNDGIKSFYDYLAYCLAGAILPEFKESHFAEAIVSQIVTFGFGYFNAQEDIWVTFLGQIEEGARAVLAETDRERVIFGLIQLLDETSDEDTRRSVTETLGEIAVGNESAIARLIQLLDETLDEDTRRSVTETLGEIAGGNEGVIARLIQLLDETSDEDTRNSIVKSLGKIAVGNERAIARLIQLLDETLSDDTCWAVGSILRQIAVGNEAVIAHFIQLFEGTLSQTMQWIVTHILGEIAVGNQGVIARLIQLLDQTSSNDTRRKVSYILGKIAVGNEGVIVRVIQLLNETSSCFSSHYTCREVAQSLCKIAAGNEDAIACLIQLLNQDSDEYTRRSGAYSLDDMEDEHKGWYADAYKHSYEENCRLFAESLGKIAVGNEDAIAYAIACLIQLLNQTSDEDTRRSGVYSLGSIIEEGNEGAIAHLIQLLDETSDEYTRRSVTEILGKIAEGNESVIARLIQLLDETSDEDTRSSIFNTRNSIVQSLGKIAGGNESAIARLIQLLDETSDENTRWSVAYNLGIIAVGNEGAIARLIQLFDETLDEYTRRSVIESLGKIAVGNEGAIARLIQLLDETSDEYTRRSVTKSLGKIAVGNESAIARLIQLLDQTPFSQTRNTVADILGEIITNKQQYYQIVFAFKPNLTDEIYEANFDFYAKSYRLIGQCAQNLSYSDFYEAWHNQSSFSERVIISNQPVKTATSEFTDKAIKVIMLAENEARRLGHDSLGTDHILLGVIAEGTNIAANILRKAGINLKTARLEIEAIVGRRSGCSPKEIPFTPRFEEVLDLASSKAEQLGYAEIDTIHIFLALINQNESVAVKLLEQLGFDVHQLSGQIIECLGYQEAELTTNISGKDSINNQPLEISTVQILSQLQPTTQTYPLPINIQSLADETDTSAICQELCTLIYYLALPDTDIPTASNFAELKRHLLTAKRQLQKRHFALILHNCTPSPPLLTCCRKIADANLGLHILWITDELLEPPLRGFPPSQDNLLGIIQTWLEEC